MIATQRLIVVRGLDETRTPLARDLALALRGPVAHLPGDDPGHRWILRSHPDPAHEVETVYRMLRLLVVGYLKDGYSVVVDAPFAAEVNEAWQLRTEDARALIRLAATFRRIETGVVTVNPVAGVPRALAAQWAADEIEGEVRVVPNLLADEGRSVRDILARLGW